MVLTPEPRGLNFVYGFNELCSTVTKTYLVETVDEIRPAWLQGQSYIGVTAGASTDEQTISEVLMKLEAIA